ncbi:hypothetical protein [Clostridium sp. DL1XJH146]
MDNTGSAILKEANFIDYYSQICSNEIKYFVTEAKYTTFFNNSILKLINELKKEDKKDIDLFINFNNEKEVVALDTDIIGEFIGDLFLAKFCKSCSKTEMGKLIQNVKDGDHETKKQFCDKTFLITYSALREIYEYVVFKKEVFQNKCNEFNIKNYNKSDKAIYILAISIVNSVMSYLKIKKDEMACINAKLQKGYKFLTTI